MRHPRLLALALATVLVALAAIAVGTGVLPIPGGQDSTLVPLASPASTATPTPEPTAPPPPEPTPARPAATPVPSGINRPGLVGRLQAALDAGREALAAPGMVASVLFPDGRQWTGIAGLADLATGRPLSGGTPFAIASVSKTFLAAEILALAEEGRLDIEGTVAPLLPGTLVGGLPIDPRITVHMLLDHTSGLRDYLVSRELDVAVRADPSLAWTPAQALAYAGKPVSTPGKGYHYANTNYVLLGLIAEGLTGHTLAEEYRTRFFDPLVLASASYQGVERPTGEMPTAYRYSSGALDAVPVDVTDGSPIRPFTAVTTAAGAAGSVAASARDLARWARALYGGHVLPAAVVDRMVGDAWATMTLDPPYPYGLGVQVLMIDRRVSYGHSGRLVGARSVMRWFPDERVAIAIVTNESRFDPAPLVGELLRIVAPLRVVKGLIPN